MRARQGSRTPLANNTPLANVVLLVVMTTLQASSGQSTRSNWDLRAAYGRDLERESAPLRSPALIGQQLSQQHQFSRNNGRFEPYTVDELREANVFQCVEPTRGLFRNFVRQYNRTFQNSAEELERLQLFALTLKRAIVLNKIIQNEVLNTTNQAIKNYHFIEPLNSNNLNLWYADITDCELALLKNVLMDVFHFIDGNKLHVAWKIVQDQGKHDLPGLMNSDGFEQLANILLVRLYDRFKGDERMNQLFEWPMYFKKLAAFAFSQRQANEPDFKLKLAYVSFAYPAYFKDLKYNSPAINRTLDNIRANDEHKKFNAQMGRKIANLNVLNRRLSVFRQRWSLVSQLNNEIANEEANQTASARRFLPDWLRVQYYNEEQPDGSGANDENSLSSLVDGQRAARLLQLGAESDSGADDRKPYKLTQFSDLTDVEFQAFLSNDYSLLANNKDSAEFLEANFPVRPLDSQLRWEIAQELELRRGGALTPTVALADEIPSSALASGQRQSARQPKRASLRLAKQVVDELISDVGLPIGAASVDSLNQEELVRIFQNVASFFQKPYQFQQASGPSQLTSSDWLDERSRRFEQFKENYGRFNAWFLKEDWHLSEAQMSAMLRLADLSWLEIKLGMFKVCCLTSDNIIALSATNSTIQYLGSNYELLCSGATGSGPAPPNDGGALDSDVGFGESGPARLQATQGNTAAANELTALELYYYYSVHFNKHQFTRAEFDRRFAIFRRNVEAIRAHSCKRSLTLFESLKDKRSNFLSSIDVLDPRRSFTDDLNLDRFEYFKLAPTTAPAAGAPGGQQTLAARLTQSRPPGALRLDSSRAGLSYRRNYFDSLLTRAEPQNSGLTTASSRGSYANKLFETWENAAESSNKYAKSNVGRIYELVLERYKWCKKNFEGVDLGASDLGQQCHANGPLGDQAAQLSAGVPLWSEEGDSQSPPSERLRQSQQQQQKPRDKCAFYRNGLDPWSEGLIRQQMLSAQLIQSAKC